MVSRVKIIVIAIVAVLSLSAGVTIWIATRPAGWNNGPVGGTAKLSEEERRKAVRDFFTAPKEYDTKNGHEMRPRW